MSNSTMIRLMVLGATSFLFSGCMGGTQPTITKTTIEKVSPSAMKTYVVVTGQDKEINRLHKKARETIDAEMYQISRDSATKVSRVDYSRYGANADDRFSNVVRDRTKSN